MEKTSRPFTLIVLPLALILAVFLLIIGTARTIAPVDQYLVTPELYVPGNAVKIHNGYTIDTTEVYVPWKYYISQFQPAACESRIQSPLAAVEAGGIRLPQGTCYPFMAVRAYTAYDSIFPLARFLSFFSAYDLSYLLFLSFLYGSFLCFFTAFLPRAS